MGVILSKFRRKKPSLEESLEKIDKELHEIRRFQIDTEVQQKQIIGRLSIVAFIVYALGILCYYLFIHTETFTWAQFILSLLPFIIFPLIIWSLRRSFSWWYQRKIVMNKEKADSLRKEKERLLDEVMDTETFKVAKKILEKYAPSHLLPKYLADQQSASARGSPSTPLTRGGQELRRRTMGGPSITPGMMGGPRPGGYPQFRPQQFMGRPPPPGFRPQAAIMGPPGTPRFRPTGMSSVPTGYTPMRYMLPSAPSAPVMHNRKTGWLDKLVDYVVGDGPTHRFALICRYCATHNGLATPDDFPYTGYRCIYCRQFNPPRQQRPSAATLPRNTVLIEEMDSSNLSGRSGPESGGEESETERATRTTASAADGENGENEPRVEFENSTTSEGNLTRSVDGGGDEEVEEEGDTTTSETATADKSKRDGEREEDIPFADEQDPEELEAGQFDEINGSFVDRINADLEEVENAQSQPQHQEDEAEGGSNSSSSSIVGKLEVNIREQHANSEALNSSGNLADAEQ